MMPESIDKSEEGVTVIIPTLNRGDYLERCLLDLLDQDYTPLEILVVDQSNTISTAVNNILQDNPSKISYHLVDFKGLPKARNYGWQKAKYERLIYIDDDIRCDSSFVTYHVNALNKDSISAVAGAIEEENQENKKPRNTGSFNLWTATPHRGFSISDSKLVKHGGGGNFSIWKQLIQSIGGFDETLNIGAALYEETEMFLRLGKNGYKTLFSGDARLIHLAAPSGGCRIEELDEYMYALAHNRAIIMQRDLNFYHLPTALGRLMALTTSYARSYKRISVFKQVVKGFQTGWTKGKKEPVCTDFTNYNYKM